MRARPETLFLTPSRASERLPLRKNLRANAVTHCSSEGTGSLARDIKPARAHFSIGVRLRLAVPDISEDSGGYLGIPGCDAAHRLIDTVVTFENVSRSLQIQHQELVCNAEA